MPILLVKTSSLGDVVHNLPVVSDLRARFPNQAIDWVVEETLVDIPRLHPAVRRVIPVAVRRWRKTLLSSATWREMAAFRHDLRNDAYDVVLDTQGLVKSGLIAAAARGRKLGYDRAAAREPLAARFYDHGFIIPKNVHAVERNRWLAAAAFDYAPGAPLDYGIAAKPLTAAWLPAAYAVLLTASSRVDKLWVDADWLQLAAWLHQRGLACVLPSGSEAERERVALLARRMERGVAAPPLEIAQLAGLFAGAALIVGVDTGLTHLATALGRPTLGLYCATDPLLTGVYGGPSAFNLGRVGNPPSAATVIEQAEKLLD
jgi:heptosyltransferase-1